MSRRSIALALSAAVLASTTACSSRQPPARKPYPPSISATTPPSASRPPRRLQIRLVQRFSRLDTPVAITSARDGSGRLFILEKTGRIRIARGGKLLPAPFLDIASKVSHATEQGLLGLAFPKDFASSGRFYIYYTDTAGTIRITAGTAPRGADRADPSSLREVLSIPHPSFTNHNGGQLAFGPDGMLYAGVGDGGSEGDPFNRAQDLGDLRGKLLRIDVGRGRSYVAPPSNPFLGRKGVRPEIWAFGLRNPWRFSFDRKTGDLFIGDVGGDAWEEVDFQPAGSSGGGQNYGWKKFEGDHPFPPGSKPQPKQGLTFPVAEYPHPFGQCVIGGYVYRGSANPSMQGVYFFGDFVKGQVFGLMREGKGWRQTTLLSTPLGITSFGEDESGELYLADWNGGVYQLLAK